jgi:DNA invertase Pin-like site-specific DNA recombinase
MTENKIQPIKVYSYVRFSTPEQLKGNSLKRQLKLSQEYADEHGLILDDSLSYQDLGKSAFLGEHRTKGALSKFLQAIKDNEVPKNAILLIEALDRLSREQVLDALTLFLEIIKHGITIVTLLDQMEYNIDSINSNTGNLSYSLGLLNSAHNESLKKSKRLLEAWEDKRAEVGEKKLTAKAPAWLKLNKHKQQFEINPDRGAVIKRIFELYLAGNGFDKITRILNKEGLPAWLSENGWQKSYISKILHNRAVIGEFQPKKKLEGKKVVIGDPIQHYYPSVISEEIFYRAQTRMSLNTGKSGKTGRVKNLFSHIAKCGYCDAPMQFLDKWDGNVYLACDKSRRGIGCINTSIRYEEFENAFLTFCDDLHLGSLLPHDDERSKKLKELQNEVESLRGELSSVDKYIHNLDKQVKNARKDRLNENILAHINKNLMNSLDEQILIENKIINVEASLARLSTIELTTEKQIQDIKQLIEIMRASNSEDLVQLRLKLRQEIRRLIDKIYVFPNGLMGRAVSPDSMHIDATSEESEEEIMQTLGLKGSLGKLTFKDLIEKPSDKKLDRGLPYPYKDLTAELLGSFEELGYDSDIWPDKKTYLEKRNKAMVEAENILKATTGKDKRCFGVFFKTGVHKQISITGTSYRIDTMDFNSLLKHTGGKEIKDVNELFENLPEEKKF